MDVDFQFGLLRGKVRVKKIPLVLGCCRCPYRIQNLLPIFGIVNSESQFTVRKNGIQSVLVSLTQSLNPTMRCYLSRSNHCAFRFRFQHQPVVARSVPQNAFENFAISLILEKDSISIGNARFKYQSRMSDDS